MSTSAAVVCCPGYDNKQIRSSLLRTFELLGGLERFVKPGQTVLIKPNFIAPKPRENCVQTDPAVILELAVILKEFGAKPFVGDSPAWGDVWACAEALGLTEPLASIGVPLKQLDNPVKCQIPLAKAKVGLSRAALEADAIINVPKLKAHQQLVATIAAKNMFGCVCGKWKPYWHFARGSDEFRFCSLILGVCGHLKPVLTIVDAIESMEGMGPIRGKSRKVGLLVSSPEVLACEMICAKVIGLEPDQLPMLRTAAKLAMGPQKASDIMIGGDEFTSNICRDFEFPEIIPIRFSLGRVCRSAFKQFLLRLGKK